MALKEHSEYKHLYVSQHPLVQHKLSLLRDSKTTRMQFKDLVEEITMLLVYECCHSLEITHTEIDTPMTRFQAPTLKDNDYVILPILRAGLGMVDGFLRLLPTARIGHMGLYRDEETLTPQQYYFKIPPNAEKQHFFICDPMLATGGSTSHAISLLRENGIEKITFVCLVAAPQGVQTLHQNHPDVPIFAAALDDGLNENGFIIPGLGDAGDRFFGTA